MSPGFLINEKIKAGTKVTVKIWCQVFKWLHLAAISTSDRHRCRLVDKKRNPKKYFIVNCLLRLGGPQL